MGSARVAGEVELQQRLVRTQRCHAEQAGRRRHEVGGEVELRKRLAALQVLNLLAHSVALAGAAWPRAPA
jgi:hypothetical protein